MSLVSEVTGWTRMLWKKKSQKQKAKEKNKDIRNRVDAPQKHPDGNPASDTRHSAIDDLKKLEARIDEKVSLLIALDERVGRRIEALEKLMYSPVAHDPAPGNADRSDGILALREKGLDAREISKILAVPAGEVELILNLNKKNRP